MRFQQTRSRSFPSGLARSIPLFAATLSLCACSSPLNWLQPGMYVGASAVYGTEVFDLDDAELQSGTNLDANGAIGGGARFGYRLRPAAALELEALRLGDYDIDVEGGGTSVVELSSVMLNLKLFNDLSQHYDMYAILGAGILSGSLVDPAAFLQEFDDSAIAGRVGLGVEASVTRRLRWTAEASYLQGFGDLEGLGVVVASVGLLYSF